MPSLGRWVSVYVPGAGILSSPIVVRMEPIRPLTISRLRGLIELTVMEEERLHAILDDDAVDGREREEALEELARVLQNRRTQLEQLTAFEFLQ